MVLHKLVLSRFLGTYKHNICFSMTSNFSEKACYKTHALRGHVINATIAPRDKKLNDLNNGLQATTPFRRPIFRNFHLLYGPEKSINIF